MFVNSVNEGVVIIVVVIILGFNIFAYDPYISETTISDTGAKPVNLDALLQSSDIISMHAPGSEETDQMLQEKNFKLMISIYHLPKNPISVFHFDALQTVS